MNTAAWHNDNKHSKYITAVIIIMSIIFICMGKRTEFKAQ